MSILRFEYFLIIIMAIVTNFHQWPRNIMPIKFAKEKPLEKCYEGLGCVKLSREWTHYRYRPTNVLPADRHAINTIFLHWTLRHGNATPEVIGSGDHALKSSGIGSSSDIRLIIHDFTSNGYTEWIHHLSHVLLTSKGSHKVGVVSVDWAAGAEPPYVQAVANARLVALEMVVFMKNLKKHLGLDAMHVHIVGHGLGAHIAGYVGKLVPKLRQITALDPSGPYFRGMPAHVKLHKTDAKHVEVIHTDCGWGGQGNKEITGHLDYFPNGGKRQPGCKREWSCFGVTNIDRSDLKLGQIYHGCSHKRAFKYYIEALARPACAFIGFACASYGEFLLGNCTSCGPYNDRCAKLNTHISTEPLAVNNNAGLFFLTATNSPFCVEILKFTLSIKKGTESWHRDVAGYLDVIIPQTGGDVTFKLNEKGLVRTFRAGYLHTFLVYHATPPVTKTPIHQLRVTWYRDLIPCIWYKHEMLLANITVVKLTDQYQPPQTFCGNSTVVTLRPDKPELFHPCSPATLTHAHHKTHATTHHTPHSTTTSTTLMTQTPTD